MMSVDPYMRGRMRELKSYISPFQLNKPLEGACVGQVIESKNIQFKVGDYVLSNYGWREYWSLVIVTELRKSIQRSYPYIRI